MSVLWFTEIVRDRGFKPFQAVPWHETISLSNEQHNAKTKPYQSRGAWIKQGEDKGGVQKPKISTEKIAQRCYLKWQIIVVYSSWTQTAQTIGTWVHFCTETEQ